MNNTKANFWLLGKRTKDITFSYEVKQKARFIKGSLISVILGLIIGGIIIAIQNVNPFEYLKQLFDIGFGSLYVDNTIQWFCIYIIAALAVGIGFKSGMFNIGVSGQMLMGAGISIIFYKLAVEKSFIASGSINGGYIFVMFLICVFSGAILAGIAGVLKALFNIHEVVTTIMLNWATWYLLKYLFSTFDKIKGDGINSSGLIPGGQLAINGSEIAIPIILAIVSVAVIAVLLSKTTFGFKLKAVGASPNASKYAGYNVKAKMIDAMLISGTLAGVASFINIFTISPNITFSVDTLPSIGYDAVAITLVAFNNPIGTIFSSFLWGTLQSAGASTAALFNLPTQMSQLIFGVIVYFAAISVVFINWFPIIKLRIMIAMSGNKADQIKVKNLHKEQLEYRQELLNLNKAKDVQDYKAMIQQQIAEQKALLNSSSKSEKQKEEIRKAIKDYKKEMNLFVKEYRKNLKEKIKKCSEEIKIIKNNNYVSKINSAREGISRREFNAVRDVEQDALSKTSLIRSNLLSLRDGYNEDFKSRKNWMKNKLHSLKKEYKLRQKQNAVWLESETGIKNHFWEMRNGKVESKAIINKIKIAAHNEILNIKSDAQMAKLDLISKYKNKPDVLKTKEQSVNDKMKAKISQVKAKEKQDISNEHEKVCELIQTYKMTKKANEAAAAEIIANRSALTKAYSKQLTIDKALVLKSADLLKQLYFDNEKNRKAVEKINDKHNTDGASLVDIRLAYNQRCERTRIWYKSECERAINKHDAFEKQYDNAKAKEMFMKAKAAVKEYEVAAKELGKENNEEIIQKKRVLLKNLIAQVKAIWPEEYSDTDHPRWSKKRMEIYNRIDKDQANLSKVAVVMEADKKIKNIRFKYKWIKQMYKENISKFKDQYMQNKKVDILFAQKHYSGQVEKFIADLEGYDFVRNDQLEEVE